ncbi:MAG: NAD(P)H-hydrate dehydratase [Clostridia bacterium]|nr:NAD(P)H-hydrate dehydratase [Clostridia bacterium]
MKETEVTKLSIDHLRAILKKRESDSHKGTYGTVNAVTGSASYRGAAVLSAMGALRAGAGIVRVCSVELVCAAIASTIPSATLLPLPENEKGMISASSVPQLLSLCRAPSVTLLGCGLGQSIDTANVVNSLIYGSSGGIVADADALNLLAASTDPLSLLSTHANGDCIITPHVGEMSRLCGKPVSEIKADPYTVASNFARASGCVTVLKDSITVIAAPPDPYCVDGTGGVTLYSSELGNAGLARGGSGDVLAGLIAGFYAQGYTAAQSAILGVITHGASADLCAAERSMQAMLPSDLGEYICKLLCSLGY